LELSDEVGPFTSGEGARFAGVPASSVGEREKGVLGRTEKETWEGIERQRNLKFFWKGPDVFTRVLKYILKGKVVILLFVSCQRLERMD
jgi:hypothetical protein